MFVLFANLPKKRLSITLSIFSLLLIFPESNLKAENNKDFGISCFVEQQRHNALEEVLKNDIAKMEAGLDHNLIKDMEGAIRFFGYRVT